MQNLIKKTNLKFNKKLTRYLQKTNTAILFGPPVIYKLKKFYFLEKKRVLFYDIYFFIFETEQPKLSFF